MIKASILVITKDRPKDLKNCLQSIRKQAVLPDEVVVVDSSSTDESELICEKFKSLNLIYKKEERLGIAYGRNTALSTALGKIIAFIDDDCVAHKNWLKNILLFLNQNSQVDVLLGRCKNYFPQNIYAVVQQCFYDRWLMESLSDYRRIEEVDAKTFCDFENIAFRKSFIKEYRCSLNLPFGGINEDIEMGHVLADKGRFVYHPGMVIYHKHKTSFKELMRRNFLVGYSDQEILETKGIDTRGEVLNYSLSVWLRECHKKAKKFEKFFRQIVFWAILFTYPFSYKTGRLARKFKLYKIFKYW